MVKPKKHLGQHFLTEDSIAQRIVDALAISEGDSVVEIGPGTGVLTQFLTELPVDLTLCEVDTESIDYLKVHYPDLKNKVLNQDFLKFNLAENFPDGVKVIGNFPYNISSQILFRVYEFRDQVPEVVGMFQKEVAQRVASEPGNKTYGILSVLLQAFYDIEYLFTVKPGSFNPPPKVDSGVIRLVRNPDKKLDLPIEFFTKVVKMAFNQRRKTLRNAIRSLLEHQIVKDVPYLDKRAEQLSYTQFIELAAALETKS